MNRLRKLISTAVLAHLTLLAPCSASGVNYEFFHGRGAFDQGASTQDVITFDEPIDSATIAESRRGFTYHSEITIDGVTFRPGRVNSNAPGLLHTAFTPERNQSFIDSAYRYPGSGEVLAGSLSGETLIDFSNKPGISAVGFVWGDRAIPGPCCVQQSISFELWNGETLSLSTRSDDLLGRTSSHELSPPDFLGFVFPDDTVRSVRLRQLGNSSSLNDLTLGQSLIAPTPPSDLNSDTVVDAADYVLLRDLGDDVLKNHASFAANFGGGQNITAEGNAVPEPAAATLLLACIALGAGTSRMF